MRPILAPLSVVLALVPSIACSGVPVDTETASGADAITTSSRNEDVQVLKVSPAPSFSLSKSSIYPALDQEQCAPEGTTWDELKAWDVETSGYLRITLDCTAAVAAKYGVPVMRAVRLSGYRTKRAEESYYGYVGFSNGGGGYWAKTVELVVKESVLDAGTFHGIGFYLNSFSYRYYEPRPAPGPDNGNAHFLFAEQVRAQAGAYPPARLPNGDAVRVIKVLLPETYALGGTSYLPAFYFRPFAEFVDGADKHQRWDSVPSDYFVEFRTEFNRERDVLGQ